MDKGRITLIDSLKGIAVILIFIVHCVGPAFPSLSRWTTYAQYGVELFLFCNGFMAMEHYIRKGIPNKAGYLIRKMIRVIPVLWLMLLVSFFLNYIELGETFNNFSHLLKNNTNASLGGVLSTMFLINFLYPKWGYFSLFSETYAVSNLLFLIIVSLYELMKKDKRRKLELVLSFGFTILLLLNLSLPLVENRITDKVVFYWIQYNCRGIIGFFVGSLTYFIYKWIKENKFILHKVDKNVWNWLYIYLITLAVFSCVYSYNWNSVYFVIYSVLILTCQFINKWKIFDNDVFCFIGKYSWSFYFIHPVVFYALYDYMKKGLLLFCTFVFSLMLSIIVTNLFEKPILLKINSYCDKLMTKN